MSFITTSNTLNIRKLIKLYFFNFSPNDAISPIVFWTNCVTSCTAATRSFSDFFSSCKSILNLPHHYSNKPKKKKTLFMFPFRFSYRTLNRHSMVLPSTFHHPDHPVGRLAADRLHLPVVRRLHLH